LALSDHDPRFRAIQSSHGGGVTVAESAAMPHLSFRDVGVTYTLPNGRAMVAVTNISVDARKGEFVCFVGPSGCGKTTVLRVAAGLLLPTAGEVCLNGVRIVGPGRERCMVFQEYGLFPWYTALDNVAYGLKLAGVGKHARRTAAEDLLRRVGLMTYAHHYPGELSGGMRQRVAIARALAVDPEVLLMDEPFGALDAQTRAELQQELLRIWEQSSKTTLFITHSIEEAVYLADRVIVMASHPGRMLQEFSVPLRRPRDKQSSEFNQLERQIDGCMRAGKSRDPEHAVAT
jgi:NitT/TauT family transport system ATP-binding protein